MPLEEEYLRDMLIGYLLTIAVETVVLLLLLSPRHSIGVKLFAGVWLSACTYPVVWLVLPEMFSERWSYLLIAETFAPVAECILFWWAFVRRLPANRWLLVRDMAAITLANLSSFAIGELIDPSSLWSSPFLF
jgi:hypothetical protein